MTHRIKDFTLRSAPVSVSHRFAEIPSRPRFVSPTRGKASYMLSETSTGKIEIVICLTEVVDARLLENSGDCKRFLNPLPEAMLHGRFARFISQTKPSSFRKYYDNARVSKTFPGVNLAIEQGPRGTSAWDSWDRGGLECRDISVISVIVLAINLWHLATLIPRTPMARVVHEIHEERLFKPLLRTTNIYIISNVHFPSKSESGQDQTAQVPCPVLASNIPHKVKQLQ